MNHSNDLVHDVNVVMNKQKEENILKNVENLLDESVKKRLMNIPIISHLVNEKSNKNFPIKEFCNDLEEKLNAINFENDNYSDPKINSVAILFSGGIDSLLLAYFVAKNVPEELNINIDLVNIAFAKGAPDRNSGLISYYELKKIFPHKKINLILVDKDYTEDVLKRENEIMSLIFPKVTHMDFNISTALNLATKLEGFLVDSNLFIEFMDKYILNVFQSKENIDDNKISYNYSNDILSKKLSIIEYENFVLKNNVMINNQNMNSQNSQCFIYKSNAKVIFSGLGADEFFGGYARYKTSWEKGKFKGLAFEMSKDINRVWTRNFGRDDRSCSDNGIELRFPFFDLDLIEYLSSVENIEYITDFTRSRGTGEKIILRKICENLGFFISHNFEKRAIQFGTRLAKETNIKKYGSNRKANGKAQFK